MMSGVRIPTEPFDVQVRESGGVGFKSFDHRPKAKKLAKIISGRDLGVVSVKQDFDGRLFRGKPSTRCIPHHFSPGQFSNYENVVGRELAHSISMRL
jgi:hypothetical protein